MEDLVTSLVARLFEDVTCPILFATVIGLIWWIHRQMIPALNRNTEALNKASAQNTEMANTVLGLLDKQITSRSSDR